MKIHLYFNLMGRLLCSLLRGIIPANHYSELSNSEVPVVGERKKTTNNNCTNNDALHRHVELRESEGLSQEYDDHDGWFDVAVSVVRIAACFLLMTVTTFVWAVIMLLLLPWPYERIRQGNLYGHVTGRMSMWILGNPIKIEGMEFSKTRGIYIGNHASNLDIFLLMWLIPTGTVGIAKKEIIWYPLFGQLYVLANHLRIDRSNPAAAIKSIKEVANALVKKELSLMIFPEGTRSKSGRLLPFKKGFVHIALQSKLPIVPMVFTGTHLAWRKNSLHVRPAPLTVKFLPPIKTDDWVEDRVSEYVDMVHDVYVQNLPESQKPVVSDGTESAKN